MSKRSFILVCLGLIALGLSGALRWRGTDSGLPWVVLGVLMLLVYGFMNFVSKVWIEHYLKGRRSDRLRNTQDMKRVRQQVEAEYRASLEQARSKPSPLTRDRVLQKAAEIFPDKSLDRIMDILDTYHSEHDAGRARVQLSVLELSQGDIDRLREYIEIACTDYRDVLFWAEVPEQATAAASSRTNEGELQGRFWRFVMFIGIFTIVFLVVGLTTDPTPIERRILVGIFTLVIFFTIWKAFFTNYDDVRRL